MADRQSIGSKNMAGDLAAARRKVSELELAAERELLELHQHPGMSRENSGMTATTEMETTEDTEAESSKKRKRKKGPNSPELARRTKKSRESGSDSEEEESDEDPLTILGHLLGKMRKWWMQPTIMKMVTKPQTQKFEKYLDAYQEELIRAREERVRIQTRLEEREAIVEIVRETVREELGEKLKAVESRQQTPTFAQVAARAARTVPKVSGLKGPVLPPPKVVVIRQEGKESEEVKKKLKELVKPSQIGLKVKRLTKIRHGVVIEADSEEGLNKLMENEALQKAGISVSKPNRRKPILMVYDVKAELEDEELRTEIFHKNMEGSEMTENEFKEEFKVRHRYKDKRGGPDTGNRCHLIVECSVRVRNWMRRKGRLYIEWESCRIKDFVDIARCYKCQRYGHVAKHCITGKASCSICAEEHSFKECKNKEKPCCSNCKREGKTDVKHPATSRQCPAYERAARRYKEQVDFGL